MLVYKVIYIVCNVSITDDSDKNLLGSGHDCCSTCRTIDEACEGIKVKLRWRGTQKGDLSTQEDPAVDYLPYNIF